MNIDDAVRSAEAPTRTKDHETTRIMARGGLEVVQAYEHGKLFERRGELVLRVKGPLLLPESTTADIKRYTTRFYHDRQHYERLPAEIFPVVDALGTQGFGKVLTTLAGRESHLVEPHHGAYALMVRRTIRGVPHFSVYSLTERAHGHCTEVDVIIHKDGRSVDYAHGLYNLLAKHVVHKSKKHP